MVCDVGVVYTVGHFGVIYSWLLRRYIVLVVSGIYTVVLCRGCIMLVMYSSGLYKISCVGDIYGLLFRGYIMLVISVIYTAGYFGYLYGWLCRGYIRLVISGIDKAGYV